MRTEVFWIDGPWQGRLAIMPRPRGGDWLEDEIQAWGRSKIDVIVSLLTPEENVDLDLVDEARLCRASGMTFVSYPVSDRSVPPSLDKFCDLLADLTNHLTSGKNVAVHCRQGIGRAGMVAAGLLIMAGIEPEAAMVRVSLARGVSVPETPEQRRWVSGLADSLAAHARK